MQELGNTQFFKVEAEKEISVKSVIKAAYDAMVEKGYNPVYIDPPATVTWKETNEAGTRKRN